MTKSDQLFFRSKQRIPGGVNSPVRAYGAVGRNPIFIERGKGSHLFDVDGKEYIDYVCSWGQGILGHANERVVQTVIQACKDGFTFGAPTRKEYEMAELIAELMPSMEMSRMVSSGTEAVMSAIRVARGFTKKDYIIKFRGCYHGHSDGLLVKAGSGALTWSVPDSAGIPKGYSKYTLIAEYNNQESVQRIFDAYQGKIAAILVEPVAANMGVVLPQPGFLEFLRKITNKEDALLIFDEVITGFRISLGGAQEYYKVIPDLTTLGKIIGGGMPVGAYGGRKEIMECVAPVGNVYQAGTLSGNPIAMTAGIETLTILKNQKELYSNIERVTRTLADAVREAFGENVQVNQVGSLMSVFFTNQSVVDLDSASTSDTERYARYFRYMLENGVNLAPSQFEAMFVSTEHTKQDIQKTISLIQKYAMEQKLGRSEFE